MYHMQRRRESGSCIASDDRNVGVGERNVGRREGGDEKTQGDRGGSWRHLSLPGRYKVTNLGKP